MKNREEYKVFRVVNQFFQCYFTERDAEKILSMLSERVLSIGTGEGEIAVGKNAFAKLLSRELETLDQAIQYEIKDYTEIEKYSGCWDCLCCVKTRIPVSSELQIGDFLRITISLHQEQEKYLIDMIHASEASPYQKQDEFFPFEFIQKGIERMNHETHQDLLTLISQIMPGGVIGGYFESGYPLYVVNKKLLEMAGYQDYSSFVEDIDGMVLNSIHPTDRDYVESEVSKRLAQSDQYELEYRMLKQDGSYIWVHDAGRKTMDSHGREAIISVLIDISEQINIKTNLELESRKDPLTGVYNRRGALEKIRKAMKNCRNWMFLMLDLDCFKQINDLYGHEEGDRALCQVAGHMMKCFRSTDVIFRYGGDEFGIFLQNFRDLETVQYKMERLLKEYKELVDKKWPKSNSTISAGGVYSYKPSTFERMCMEADRVMYEVKRSGKGYVKIQDITE